VELETFLMELEKTFGEFEENEKTWIIYYLDVTKDGLISSYDIGRTLIFFGDFRNFISNLKKMRKSKLFIAHISSMHSKVLLENKSKFSFLFRFSKSDPGSFALSIVDKSQKIIHTLFNSSLFFNKMTHLFNKSLSFNQHPSPSYSNHITKVKPGRRSSEKTIFNNIAHFFKSYRQILLNFIIVDETLFPYLFEFKNITNF
jgi:hypothetical protein